MSVIVMLKKFEPRYRFSNINLSFNYIWN